jgi:hypothetical protein
MLLIDGRKGGTDMWLALSLKQKAEISILGKTIALPISDLADGCIGCLLVFETKEDAAACVGESGGGSIVQVVLKEEENG